MLAQCVLTAQCIYNAPAMYVLLVGVDNETEGGALWLLGAGPAVLHVHLPRGA
jgi:hypothetical protein